MATLSLALTVCACSSKVSPDGAPEASASAASDGSTAPASAETSVGPRIESITFASKALARDIGFDIYLPPGYDNREHYPALYMLYGYGGDQHSWFSSLSLGATADSLLAHHAISPLIIVSPGTTTASALTACPGAPQIQESMKGLTRII